MRVKSTYRLRGSTLTEVLISLSLISLVFVLGAWVWLQVNGSRSPARLAEQRLKAREILLDASLNDLRSPVSFTWKGTQFVRSLRPLNPARNLYEVRVTCYAPGDEKVFERAQIRVLYAD